MSSNLIPSSRALILNYDLVLPTGLLKGFPVRVGVTHGPLVKWLRHRSFTARTVGSIPPRVTIRHLYTVVKDRTHHGCLVVCTTQQLRISLQVKPLLQRVDGGFDTDHM